MADDVAALDDAFAPGPGTLRGDSTGLLVGHEAISAFRSTRGGITPRVLDHVESRRLADDCWLIVATSRYDGGGTGLQTQVWQRVDGRWRITAAHVTGRTPSFDTAVWRTVGDPLYQGAFEVPLLGVRVAVKDVFAVRGYRIGAATPRGCARPPASASTPPRCSTCSRAGASVRGLARTDELAYSIAGANPHYGTPPTAPSRGPCRALVERTRHRGRHRAGGRGLATDTAGSVRVPASYQGLWGLRTTHVWSRVRDAAAGAVVRRGRLADPDRRDPGARRHLVPRGRGPLLPARRVVPVEVLRLVEPATREAFEAWAGGAGRGGRGRRPRRLVRGVPRRAGSRGVARARCWVDAHRTPSVPGARAVRGRP